jgi:hypothetical protein
MLSWQQVTAYDATDKHPTNRPATAMTKQAQPARRANKERLAQSASVTQTQRFDRAQTPQPVAAPVHAPPDAPHEQVTAPPARRSASGPAPSADAPDAATPAKPVIIPARKTGRSGSLAHSDDRAGPEPSGAKGQRSKAARVVVLAAVVATLFAALAVASPAGTGVGLDSALRAYANAMPWIAPTPTPTPPPNPQTASGANPDKAAIIADIQAVFGPYSAGALNIARCESGYDPNARNTIAIGNSHAEGVFQILYPSTWNGTSYHNYSPYNSWANIRAAYEIFKRDGYSWREWACRP